MTARVTARFAPAVAQIREQFAWLPKALQVLAVPTMALLWWALAFLPWTRLVHRPMIESWPPTLPTLFTDLGVTVFGSLGAALVVIVLVRSAGLAFVAVLTGYVVSAVVTVTQHAEPTGYARNASERIILLVACAVAALVGLAIGTAAMRSLQVFGFLGLLAVFPVVSLMALVLLDARSDQRWLIRSALVVLMVMIAWRRWTGVLVWPIFFVLFWLLRLVMSAVDYGAATLRHPGGAEISLRSVADSMLYFVRSAWRVMLETGWHLFWPAALIAVAAVAVLFGWRFARGQIRQAPPEQPRIQRQP